VHPGEGVDRRADRQRTARVMRVAMRTAVAMLSSGAQSDEVEAIAVAVASAFDVHGVQAAVTFSTITLSHDASDLEAPMWIVYLAVPVGSFLMCFRFLQVALAFARTGELPHTSEGHVEGLEKVAPGVPAAAAPPAAAHAKGGAQ